MIWLKLFEDFSNKDFSWQMEKQDQVYVYYFKVAGNSFYLTFTPSKKLPNVWLRKYGEETDRYENIFSGKTALRIFPMLAEITEDFIKQEYPDMIVIPHVSLPNEKGILNTLNKRAKYNYQHLKTIKGYHLQYFNEYFKYYSGTKQMYGEPKTTTVGFLLKNGTSKTPNDWFNIPKLGSSFGEDTQFPVEP